MDLEVLKDRRPWDWPTSAAVRQRVSRVIEPEQDHGPDFPRFANALSALYSKWSEKRRLLDAMLRAIPR